MGQIVHFLLEASVLHNDTFSTVDFKDIDKATFTKTDINDIFTVFTVRPLYGIYAIFYYFLHRVSYLRKRHWMKDFKLFIYIDRSKS